MKRVYGLDYLRGLAAFSIALYHLFTWNDLIGLPSSMLAKFGIYGVSIFFIISGYALTHVSMVRGLSLNTISIANFYKKRIARIFPLYWFTLVLTLLVSSKKFDLFTIILNIFGLFSLVDPNAYISGGSWSIGIELVFYIFFPLFFLLFQGFKGRLICIILTLSLFLYGAFDFSKIQINFSILWSNYVNPINHMFFFLIGMLCRYFQFSFNKNTNWVWLIIGLTLLFIYPINTKAELIIGLDRVILSGIACLLAIPFINFDFSIKQPFFIHKSLMLLGDISYSLYLLHPIVYATIKKFFQFANIEIGLLYYITCLILSLMFSFFSYQIVEKKGQRIFKWILK